MANDSTIRNLDEDRLPSIKGLLLYIEDFVKAEDRPGTRYERIRVELKNAAGSVRQVADLYQEAIQGPAGGEVSRFVNSFPRRVYDPEAALAAARSALPLQYADDQYWLPFVLICVNGDLDWMLDYIHWRRPEFDHEAVQDKIAVLSSGEQFLAQLALHLLNSVNRLPDDGLLGLRVLDDYRYPLALHAIRMNARGVGNRSI